MKRIKIFDTTLRDGEQSPGCSMNLPEKIEMAKQLERLGVDIHGCAVFEDAQSGIEAAKRAGAGKIIQAASMKQPHINRDADRVIRDYCDVDGLLAELGLGPSPGDPTNA